MYGLEMGVKAGIICAFGVLEDNDNGRRVVV